MATFRGGKLAVVCAVAVIGLACERSQEAPIASAPAERASAAGVPATGAKEATVKTASGLSYDDVKQGTGAAAQTGKTAVVHYTGWLTDGKKFDSSKDRGQPFRFVVGRGQVIKGWDEGVASMQIGGVRKLTIPPELGYGASGAGGVIPPNATLVFEVELLGVE